MNFSEIPVILQNDDLLVVDKPTGISIHNTEDASNLISVLTDSLRRTNRDVKLYPVHRLDKETSGVQLFAKNEKAASKYAKEFESRSVTKTYSGILRGGLHAESKGDSLSSVLWSWPLTDKAEGRNNPAGIAAARIPCETRVRVLKMNKFFTRCEFDLITGRQHQIRKHAVLARHALVGDARYGDAAYNRKMSELYQTSRLFLHCGHIEIDGLSLQAPVPTDFDQLLPLD